MADGDAPIDLSLEEKPVGVPAWCTTISTKVQFEEDVGEDGSGGGFMGGLVAFVSKEVVVLAGDNGQLQSVSSDLLRRGLARNLIQPRSILAAASGAWGLYGGKPTTQYASHHSDLHHAHGLTSDKSCCRCWSR